MVLKKEFWDSLTDNQKEKFSDKNSDPTYKKAVMYQVFSAILFMFGIGLFLPVAHTATEYWKGYCSLTQKKRSGVINALCVLNVLFGLLANVVIAAAQKDYGYGEFINTMSRRQLEIMLEQTRAQMGDDDPFRIANFSGESDTDEGTEKSNAIAPGAVLAVNVLTVVLLAAMWTALIVVMGSNKAAKAPAASAPSSSSSQASSSSSSASLKISDITGVDVLPESLEKGSTKYVGNTGGGLNLRKGPATKYEKIVNIPAGSKITLYNDTDNNQWSFIGYKKSGKTYYGWVSNDYIVDKDGSSASSAESSSAASSAESSSGTSMTADEFKSKAAKHFKALEAVYNDFVGYLTYTDSEKSAVSFGSYNLVNRYYLVTNASSNKDLSKYLQNYMITSLADKKCDVEEVKSNESIPDSPVVIYNGKMYISESAEMVATLDTSTLKIESSTDTTYVVTLSSSDGKKFSVKFQNIDNKLMITSYSVS